LRKKLPSYESDSCWERLSPLNPSKELNKDGENVIVIFWNDMIVLELERARCACNGNGK
jgi:hypothetical protein